MSEYKPTSAQASYDAVKKATVAIVISQPDKLPKLPFTILGSGFCVHPKGVVVTCEHVFKSFVEPESYQRIMQAATGDGIRAYSDIKSKRPYVIFYRGVYRPHIYMIPVPIVNAVTKTNFDLAALQLDNHTAFSQGYPTLPIADYDELHEMMEVATCGFPLGEVLKDQIGTVTSSFTKGIISSIIPAPGVPCKDVRGFQLDLTATNGNSGGPVFSLATGRVFGVLQCGIIHHQTRQIVQGLTKAEPVYPIFDNGLIDRLATCLNPKADLP